MNSQIKEHQHSTTLSPVSNFTQTPSSLHSTSLAFHFTHTQPSFRHLFSPLIRSPQDFNRTPQTSLTMKFTIFSASKLSLLALITSQFSTTTFGYPSPSVHVEKRGGGPLVMGLAKTFGAIAATTLTSTGDTLITGDCGTCPGTAITGFPPGDCTGTTSAGGTAACNAEAACLSAYNDAWALSPTIALTSSNLGGITLGPGTYTFPTSAASLSGTLTLNGTIDAGDGQYVFLIDTTFTVAAAAEVVLINGAQACNVYFIVGSSATIGAGAIMQGNILAYTSIGVANAVSNDGTWCALNGAVTLINDALTAKPVCTT